jgi:hypothetical protein
MNTGWLDKLIIIVAIALCVSSYLWLWQATPGHAVSAEIKSEGELDTISLLEDKTLSIQGPLGISKIQIKDGKARFLSSPCNNQYCVRAGWLKENGDTAICLPNAVSLRLVGGEQLDAINF